MSVKKIGGQRFAYSKTDIESEILPSQGVFASKHVAAKFTAELLLLGVNTGLVSGQIGSPHKGLFALLNAADMRSWAIWVVGLQVCIVIPYTREVFPALVAVEVCLTGVRQAPLFPVPRRTRWRRRPFIRVVHICSRRNLGTPRPFHRAVITEFVVVHEPISHYWHVVRTLGAEDVFEEERWGR